MLRRLLTAAAIVLLSVLAFAVSTPVVLRALVQRHMYERAEDTPRTGAALVLGASVSRGKPSPVLEARTHAAVQLYFMGKVPKILVTGDNGALSHDEVTPVRKYLLDAGVPARDIVLDHAGFDTYSSMYRARDVFDASAVTIVTQDFHLPRALFIARRLGLDAHGLDAGGGRSSPADYIREIPASVKALFDLASKRVPKYLGEKLPLSTIDGSTTWY